MTDCGVLSTSLRMMQGTAEEGEIASTFGNARVRSSFLDVLDDRPVNGVLDEAQLASDRARRIIGP